MPIPTGALQMRSSTVSSSTVAATSSSKSKMASQQGEKAAELQDPRVRAELDRRVREEGATVIKSGGGGTTLDAQERLAEGRKKGGLSRTTESGDDGAEREGGAAAVRVEPDEKQLQEAMKSIGRG